MCLIVKGSEWEGFLSFILSSDKMSNFLLLWHMHILCSTSRWGMVFVLYSSFFVLTMSCVDVPKGWCSRSHNKHCLMLSRKQKNKSKHYCSELARHNTDSYKVVFQWDDAGLKLKKLKLINGVCQSWYPALILKVLWLVNLLRLVLGRIVKN